MSLNDRIRQQRQKLAAAKRRMNQGGAKVASTKKFNGAFKEPTFEYNSETKNNFNVSNEGRREKDTGSRGGSLNNNSPAYPASPTSFVGFKVRASGVMRTPEARHSDFRRMSFYAKKESSLGNLGNSSGGRDDAYSTSRSRESSPIPEFFSPTLRESGTLNESPNTSYNEKFNEKFNELSFEMDSIKQKQLRQQRVSAHLNRSDPEPEELHTVIALREELQLKNSELKAAREELSFTGEIMDMLRADIAKTDAEHNKSLVLVSEAKEMKLRANAEVDVLNEQVATRDRIINKLKNDYEQVCLERDVKEKNHRELREKHDRFTMDTEINKKRYDVKLEGVVEELSITQDLHNKQKRRIGELERQMDQLSKENSTALKEKSFMEEKNTQLKENLKKMSLDLDRNKLRLKESKVACNDLEIEINHTKGLLKSGNSDANKRSKKLEVRVQELASEVSV